MKLFLTMMFYILLPLHILLGQNQTEDVSSVYSEDDLPFSIEISEANFSLPTGLQSYVAGIYDNKWILLAGRTNGMHGFSGLLNNFAPTYQNTNVYVMDPLTGEYWQKSLNDSDLSQEEIDCLSVTAARVIQKDEILYLVGGYGINTLTEEMETKSTLTAINLNHLSNFVRSQSPELKKAIRQTSHPLLQVTGGGFFQLNDKEPMLLTLGQNFAGIYRAGSNGDYVCQIRSFYLKDDGKNLSIEPGESLDKIPSYRRRDLNIVPILDGDQFAYMAFSGVFTLDTGIWTLPIKIFPDGHSEEIGATDSKAFKQPMNHYNCAAFGLYSSKKDEMYVVFSGGISYGFFKNGIFITDPELPFVNQVSTIKIAKNNQFTQHYMNNEYPYIESTGSNPENQLLFGTEAIFFPKASIPLFNNGVIQLDKIKFEPIVIGHIVGGIMSTVPNTQAVTDTTSSPYIFEVTLKPKKIKKQYNKIMI